MKEIKVYLDGFKVNDEIYLRKDSRYYNQQFDNGRLMKGYITSISTENPEQEEYFRFSVRWETGNINNYRLCDIKYNKKDVNIKTIIIPDENKIYLKSCNEITINGVLDKLYSRENDKAQETYWKTDTNELYLHCVANKMRSYDDLYYLCKTYIPNVTHEEMIKSLLLYKQNDIFEINIFLYNCTTMNKIRYEFGRNKSFVDIYNTAIKVHRYNSLYSWGQLFKMININSLEDFKEFYKLNLNKNEKELQIN